MLFGSHMVPSYILAAYFLSLSKMSLSCRMRPFWTREYVLKWLLALDNGPYGSNTGMYLFRSVLTLD